MNSVEPFQLDSMCEILEDLCKLYEEYLDLPDELLTAGQIEKVQIYETEVKKVLNIDVKEITKQDITRINKSIFQSFGINLQEIKKACEIPSGIPARIPKKWIGLLVFVKHIYLILNYKTQSMQIRSFMTIL